MQKRCTGCSESRIPLFTTKSTLFKKTPKMIPPKAFSGGRKLQKNHKKEHLENDIETSSKTEHLKSRGRAMPGQANPGDMRDIRFWASRAKVNIPICSLLSALCSLLSALWSLLSALCSLLSALCSLLSCSLALLLYTNIPI